MESSLPRPLKELKGFKKVNLAPGETVKVNFTIGKEALSFYTPERHEWVVEPGKFQILVGTASDDIRSSATSCRTVDTLMNIYRDGKNFNEFRYLLLTKNDV